MEALNTNQNIQTSMLKWLAGKSDEAIFEPKKGYYPFSVIADAYEVAYKKGETAGREVIEKDIKESFRRTIVAYSDKIIEAVNLFVDTLNSDDIKATKFFLNHSMNGAKVMFTIPEEDFIKDSFLDKYFGLVSDYRAKNVQEDYNVDVNFIIDAEDLNLDLIKAEGFGLAIDLQANENLY